LSYKSAPAGPEKFKWALNPRQKNEEILTKNLFAIKVVFQTL